MLAYERGDRIVLLNTTSGALAAPETGEIVIETRRGALTARELSAHSGAVCVALAGFG
jgi:hypothetical protein